MTGLVHAEPPPDEKALAAEFRALAKREATAYTIRLEGSDRPLTLQPEPVLKWSNPVVGTVYGEVFVWTDQGTAGGRGFDLQILLAVHPPGQRVPFAGSRAAEGQARRDHVWTPSEPGWQWRRSPAPRTGRLRRGKAPPDALTAQEFTGRQTTREGVDRDMRLLTQPIYRYENTKGDLIDGGFFAFVLGTAPKCLC